MIYWYPNRPILLPKTAHEFGQLSDSPDWTAEIKMDGNRLVLRKLENGKWEFMNRHKKPMSYTPSPEVMAELNALNVEPKTQLDGELMHTRTKNVKHQIVFYDVYVLNGEKQRGTLRERREILRDLLDGKGFNHLVQSEVYYTNFKDLFDKVITCREHEGLVLKDVNGKIKFSPVKSDDVAWQYKVRRPHKNYKF
jgi:ATP-dependent DNA ligase